MSVVLWTLRSSGVSMVCSVRLFDHRLHMLGCRQQTKELFFFFFWCLPSVLAPYALVKNIDKNKDDIEHDNSYFITTLEHGEQMVTEWNPELRLVSYIHADIVADSFFFFLQTTAGLTRLSLSLPCRVSN